MSEDSASLAIEAWRQRGDHRFDPVRFRWIEALARRSAGCEGPARRLLERKLAQLLAAYGADLASAESAASADQHLPPAQGPARRGPLAELVDEFARRKPPPVDGPDGGAAGQALSYLRGTWSKLSADRRLTQSRAKLPPNAGPLHSHQLVHRSLLLMREVSPEYLHQFMAYVDALLWLDQMAAASAPAAPEAARAEKPRSKTTRRRKTG
ncbi:MAG TPA: DUF2894 domain-containing protein [Variovorax sp.]|jgi:hypothetical protein